MMAPEERKVVDEEEFLDEVLESTSQELDAIIGELNRQDTQEIETLGLKKLSEEKEISDQDDTIEFGSEE